MAGESSKLQNLEIVLQDREAKPCDLPLQVLKDITSDFSDKQVLGRGGSGVVYEGVLGNGQIVAVKKFVFMPGVDNRQFENEVHHLVMLRHPNIVRFLGYCSETRQLCIEHEGKYRLVEMQERLLCLEYMAKGSLKKHISDESCGLDWHTRYKIIKGICCGLHYLHEESQTNTPIIHLDLKPDNILLTNEMEPKITDFGLSRLFGEDQSRTCTTSIFGTLGYMAREYINKGIISKKSDIFGLGVIVIEIITGCRDYPSSTGKSQQDFLENVLGKWRKRLEDLRCKSLENDCRQIETCIQIGLKCVQTDADQRPTTKEIIQNLKDSMCMHGIKQEWSPVTDQVLQNSVNLSQTDIFPHTDLKSSDHQTSLNVSSKNTFPAEPPPHVYAASGFRTCAGCHNPIGYGRFLSCMGSVWHPQCFRCFACNKPISEYEFAMHDDQPYHRSCYKEFFHPKCDVCDNFIPTNRDGLIEYRVHPFWMQKYCPSHEDDNTPRCYCCERMQPTGTNYKTLGDGRKLCLDCLSSAVMDIPGIQELYYIIQDFFEGLGMKVERQVPLLLVERHALNEAMEAERSGRWLPDTRGLCVSQKESGIRMIFRRLLTGPGNRTTVKNTGLFKLSRQCDVTGIHILYGLPRLLTGSILAHMMMGAYLGLQGYPKLSSKVDSGICQVISHMWLELKINPGSSGNAPSSSSSSCPTHVSSNIGAMTEFEKKLGAFIKHQIETNTTETSGDGFRDCYRSIELWGLRSTLDHVKRTGSFPGLN